MGAMGMTTYGLPTGTNIAYGEDGFPEWVYELAAAFNLRAATYPGHQESERAEKGFAPNPRRQNRGIDFTGSTPDLQRFAEYMLSIRGYLEQLIWQNPVSNQHIGVAGGQDVSATGYYAADTAGHRDHVHVRTSQPLPLPGKEPTTVGWTGDPVWLEDVLRAYDGPKLKVRALPNWKEYGHGDMLDIRGVMIHHTGNARETAESIRKGRPDLPGPLAQLHIAPDGTVTVVAGGVCWHAGQGSYTWLPRDMGNQHMIGIECAWPQNTSLTPETQWTELWPDAQIIAMRDTTAAILMRLGLDQSRVIGHKEYAKPPNFKWDPGSLDMSWFRAEVSKAMRGKFKPQQPSTPPPANNNPLASMSDREILEAIYRRIDGLAIGLGK